MNKRFYTHSSLVNACRRACLCSILLFIAACHKETKAERYAREAKETTAQCPMTMDVNTTLDSMTYSVTNHRFTYYYMVNGISDSFLVANEQRLRQQVIDRLLNATDMIPYIKDGVSFRYVYRTDSFSKQLLDFTYENKALQK